MHACRYRAVHEDVRPHTLAPLLRSLASPAPASRRLHEVLGGDAGGAAAAGGEAEAEADAATRVARHLLSQLRL